MKKKILVTGVAGFIGSNLADRLLAEGHFVRGIDDLSAGLLEQVPKGVDFHKLDIRSKEIFPLFEGMDVVFHLAAKNSIQECQKEPVETADVDIMGTLNVFEAARASKVGRIIHAESSAIYEASTRLPTPETDFAPRTFYAISKAAGHLFAQAYQEFYGLRMVGLRYMNVYGPRQDYRRAVPTFIVNKVGLLLTGQKPWIFGDGSKRRDYIHVDDVNDFHLVCMEDDRALGKVFNLGNGTNYSVREVLDSIQDILGTHADVEFRPNIPGEAQENLGDISEARKLGWEPKVSLREGLVGMVDYMKKEIAAGRYKPTET
jgi:UDP-glucose 4-epimerase